jgi:hypothetical protein
MERKHSEEDHLREVARVDILDCSYLAKLVNNVLILQAEDANYLGLGQSHQIRLGVQAHFNSHSVIGLK